MISNVSLIISQIQLLILNRYSAFNRFPLKRTPGLNVLKFFFVLFCVCVDALRPSQQFFSHVKFPCLPGLNQY